MSQPKRERHYRCPICYWLCDWNEKMFTACRCALRKASANGDEYAQRHLAERNDDDYYSQ
jgi:hypothetical protein